MTTIATTLEKTFPKGRKKDGDVFVELLHRPDAASYPFAVHIAEGGDVEREQLFWTLRDAMRFYVSQITALEVR